MDGRTDRLIFDILECFMRMLMVIAQRILSGVDSLFQARMIQQSINIDMQHGALDFFSELEVNCIVS